jgi:nucleoside phosphorylase
MGREGDPVICVQICAHEEWQVVLSLSEFQGCIRSSYPHGQYFDHPSSLAPCRLFHSGDTKTKSAAACQYAIDSWKPDAIFLFGTCGGVDNAVRVGDLVLADRTGQFDCILRMNGKNEFFYPSLDVSLDNSWLDFSLLPQPVHRGLIASADQDINYSVRRTLKAHGAVAADWESGAVAYVCARNSVRCCILKGISDIPIEDGVEADRKQGREYGSNIAGIMENLMRNALPVLLKKQHHQPG